MAQAKNVTVEIISEVNSKACDLVIVRADHATYVVEVKRDIAKLGDRVDFLEKEHGLISGYVEDILRCDILDDLYCFIGTAVQIYKPCGVFKRVWASDQLRESLLF